MIRIDRKLIPTYQFYVAVSGGIDSLAGAHLLHRFNPGRVSIFHYNHNLRLQNDMMEHEVRRFAHDISIPFVTEKRDAGGLSDEASLREDRMAAFRKLNSPIVLCHHLDDAVESYVMNMLKGKPEHVPITKMTQLVCSHSTLLRPFIRTRKKDFIDYAESNSICEYLTEDETNIDPTHCRRNYIRHKVLPMFQGMGLPKVVLKKFYTP